MYVRAFTCGGWMCVYLLVKTSMHICEERENELAHARRGRNRQAGAYGVDGTQPLLFPSILSPQRLRLMRMDGFENKLSGPWATKLPFDSFPTLYLMIKSTAAGRCVCVCARACMCFCLHACECVFSSFHQ